MKNKKGISSVVASITLIVISIVGVAMLSLIVKNFIKMNEAKLSPSVNCINWLGNPPIKIGEACLDKRDQKVKLILNRDLSEEEIYEMKAVLYEGNFSYVFNCGGDSCKRCEFLKKGESKDYYIKSERNIDRIIIELDGCKIYQNIVEECKT